MFEASCRRTLGLSSAMHRLLVTWLMMSGSRMVQARWTYPESGWATMTHYDLPRDYIASCGCTGRSTHYPTAAINTLAYGSTAAYGPACGRCFNLTLVHSLLAVPTFYPTKTKWIVIKVTDRCPGETWCGAKEGKPNNVGAWLNFDLAYPSKAIPNDFFPHNESFYGYKDFGVWNISYQSVTCKSWNGWGDQAALGSVPDMNPSVCCPAEPLSNLTCTSFSEEHGIWPPDTTTGTASPLYHQSVFSIIFLISVVSLLAF